MRSLLPRLAVLGALALSLSACSGSGSTLPLTGPPNNAGGTPGTFVPGSNGTSLLRFVQGSPDYSTVDICLDQAAFNVNQAQVGYGKASALGVISGGVPHTLTVYPTVTSAPGSECATAPAPFSGTAPIRVSTFTIGNNVRWSIVLGGSATTGTLGLYIYGDPSFVIAPSTAEAISHNTAPGYTAANKGVGFGYILTTGGTATNLSGANNVAVAKVSTATTATVNTGTTVVTSALPGQPVSFFDGIGTTGTPAPAVVPVTTIAAPAQTAGQPYVIQLFAIDAAAGGLGLVAIPESVSGYGF